MQQNKTMETEQTQPEYAGFWARVAAYFLDGAITAFLTVNSFWLVRDQLSGYFALHPDALKMFKSESDSSYTGTYDVESKIMYYYIAIFSFIFSWIYFAGFESSPAHGPERSPGRKRSRGVGAPDAATESQPLSRKSSDGRANAPRSSQLRR